MVDSIRLTYAALYGFRFGMIHAEPLLTLQLEDPCPASAGPDARAPACTRPPSQGRMRSSHGWLTPRQQAPLRRTAPPERQGHVSTKGLLSGCRRHEQASRCRPRLADINC